MGSIPEIFKRFQGRSKKFQVFHGVSVMFQGVSAGLRVLQDQARKCDKGGVSHNFGKGRRVALCMKYRQWEGFNLEPIPFGKIQTLFRTKVLLRWKL